MMSITRRSDIDVYKGILIWLVVLSHIMAISEYWSDSFIFKLIVNSHIPLLLMVSGYLFNIEKFFKASWVKRIILPWIISNCVYLLLPEVSFSISGMIVGFTTHLWYIPAIIIFMFLVWVGELFKRNFFFVFLLAIAIVFQFNFQFSGDNLVIRGIRFCISNFRLQFFIYFLIGYLLKKDNIKISLFILWIVLGVFLLVIASLDFRMHSVFKLIGNILLMGSLLKKNIKFQNDNRIIIFLCNSGQNSMFIYLWHVVPLLLPMPSMTKYICMIVWQLIIWILINQKKRNHFAYLVGLV